MAEVFIRLLNREALERLGVADVAAAVADVRETLRLAADGAAVMPPEVAVRFDDRPAGERPAGPAGGPPGGSPRRDAAVYALPAYVGGPFSAIGVKWTAHRPPDAGDGAPRILSVTVLNDARTGRPVAVLESALITAMRTAAVSWLAMEHLGRTAIERVGILGAGSQARQHLRMLAHQMPRLTEVLVWNRGAAHAEALARTFAHEAPWPIRIGESVGAVAAASDVLITCTAAPTPIVDRACVRPGLLAIQVGFHEFSFEAIEAFDQVVVDGWGEFRLTSQKSLFRMHRAGRFPAERVAADLTDLVWRGRAFAPGQSVYVSSFGLSVFDVAIAARLARAGERAGIGQLFPLGGFPQGEWPG
ncbi:MAG TPA: ornithine cyclodeaminase [Methylomirabilota bacterium]|nr:ornithine cyclodeaminase [Methylomirabilota bacterium]